MTMCQPSSTTSLRYSLYPTSGHSAVYFKLSGKNKEFTDTQIFFTSSKFQNRSKFVSSYNFTLTPLNKLDNVYERCRNFYEYYSKIENDNNLSEKFVYALPLKKLRGL